MDGDRLASAKRCPYATDALQFHGLATVRAEARGIATGLPGSACSTSIPWSHPG
jgi:hypothetical protein